MNKGLWLIVPAVVFLAGLAYLLSLDGEPVRVPSVPEGWRTSEPDAQGMTFWYPATLPSEYYSEVAWPPSVEHLAQEYSCVDVEERIIEDRPYCVSETSEGAVGSTYTTYEYRTDREDGVFRIMFTIRFPQCLNYDEPKQSACKSEQDAFSPDTLAQGLVDSIELP
jgi:hypothetical protein